VLAGMFSCARTPRPAPGMSCTAIRADEGGMCSSRSSERILVHNFKARRQKLTGFVDRSVRGLMDLDSGMDGFSHTSLIASIIDMGH
jgi:hypothetical protein